MTFGLSGRMGGLEALEWPVVRAMLPKVEALGYTSIWFNEEHFLRGRGAEDRSTCSPLILAALVAAQTTRLRIGFSALIVPLHHPLRLAEDIASLDQLSEGRIDFGISRGHAGQYFQAFGVEPDDRTDAFRTSLERILGWWAGDPVTAGEQAAQIAPSPVQQPHPPVYVAAYSDGSVAWAASQGHHLIQHGIQSIASVRRCLTTYADAGGAVRNVPVGRFVYVGRSDRAARAEAWPVVEQLTGILRKIRSERFDLIHDATDLEPERFYESLAIIGGPETCAARIAELRDGLGIRHVNLLPSLFGLVPPDLLVASLERFAGDVAPALAH
jgi:alkanesulfonate monooxygenase SsuD/methylene tetrahydromethanopterin reductase-like flavin-dependent oxidoreductase (luciferase family)